MAQIVNISGQQYKRRNIVAVWLLAGLFAVFTLDIYFFVWYYRINDESRRYLNDPSIKPVLSLLAVLLGWIVIVPPFVSIYRTAGRIRRMQRQAGLTNVATPWIALVLAFVFSLHTLYLQNALNDIWDRYLLPAGTYPPSGYPLPPPQPPSLPPPPRSA
jgi:Domain of unknown function (DUF4234)